MHFGPLDGCRPAMAFSNDMRPPTSRKGIRRTATTADRFDGSSFSKRGSPERQAVDVGLGNL